MNSVITLPYVGEGVAAFVLSGAGIPRARGSVVVMRAGINNFLAGASMRQVHMRAFVSESELEHRHARQLQPIAQGMHFGGDVTEILGKERQSAQSLAQRLKQIIAR